MSIIGELKVIDVDAHITESADLWTSRAPAAYVDRVPTVVERPNGLCWSVDGVLLGRALGGSVIARGRTKVPGVAFMSWEPGVSDPSAYDMVERIKVLDYQQRRERDSVPPAVDALGAEHVLFETDYPHPTCLYPDPLGQVAALEERLGADTMRKVLQDDAATLYRIDIS